MAVRRQHEPCDRRDDDRHAARRRRGRRRLRLHAQGAPDLARGLAVPRARAARPHAARSRPRLPRRRRARRALRARRPRARAPGASSASATSCRSTCARSPRAPRRGRPGRVPARRLPRPRRARRLPRAPRAARSTTRATRALLGGAARATTELRARLAPRARARAAGHHAYLGGLLEHTVAVGDAGARGVHAAPAPGLATCCSPRRSCTTSARRASSPTAPRSALHRGGRLLGHVELGLRLLDERARRPALDDERRLALAHCVLIHHGAGRGAGPALRLGRGARAVPRSTRSTRGQGRARARAGPRRPKQRPLSPRRGAQTRADQGRRRSASSPPARARSSPRRGAARS